ncbi:MAG: TolC family protein [Acidobacteriota bacterium]
MRKTVLLSIILILFNSVFMAETEEKRELTLQDAIFHALKNNLDLQIELTNTESSRLSKVIRDTSFIPSLTIDLGKSETNSPSTGVLSGADISKNENMNLDLKLTQKYALGGTLNVELSNRRSESNSFFTSINPSLRSVLTFSVNQPLLKGFGTFATKKDILISINDYIKSKYQLKKSIIDLVYNVEDYYWNLVYRHQNLEATKKALEKSRKLLKQNELKVKVGIAAPIDILEAKAEVASYESQLIQAEQNVQSAEDNLRKILNLTSRSERIVPLDKPEIKKIETDFNKFLLEALNNRPDIRRAKLDLKNNNIRVKYAKNQLLPDLQLTASYYTTGQGGDQLIYGPGSIFAPREVIGVVKKDMWKTLNDAVANIYKNYSISLSLNLPLSFKKERAELAQARLNMKSSYLSLKKVESDIYSEVKEVIKELETNLKLADSNKISLRLEEMKLKAEEKKLSVGLSTNYQVLNYQRDFMNAQTNKLKSIIDYKLSIAKINKALARTFESYNIKFSEIGSK